MQAEATAPGKAILFGEHSVVYRGPAIVLAVDKKGKVIAEKRDKDNRIYFDALDLGFSGYFEGDKYTPITGADWRGERLAAFMVAAKKTMENFDIKSGLNIKIRSDIPIAAGLGSSAALSVATVGAVGELFGGLSKEEICNIAYEGEKIVHGNPSGIDNNISTYGGVLVYEKGKELQRVKLGEDFPFIIGDSKRKRSTKKLVRRVRDLRDRQPELIDGIIDNIARISVQGLGALKDGDFRTLGDLMNVNHGLLSALGVSIAKLDTMVHASRGSGAYGAKLTGAGGGGCMMAIADAQNIRSIEKAIWRCRSIPHVVNIAHEGVQIRRIE